jgi:hypothetical protein
VAAAERCFRYPDMVIKSALAALAGERAVTGRTSMPAARTAALVAGACLSVTLAACSSPTKPSASVVSARPVSPATGTQVAYNTQPVKLLVDNGLATGGVPLSDTFEVATDAAFATVVVSKSVAQSASGQTSLVLDPLPPATYYWRVRGGANGATVTSATFTFNIAVALPLPVLVSPASGVLIGHLDQPIKVVVQNPAPTPPVSGVTNSFDVAADAAFADIVVSKTVPTAATGPTVLVLDPLAPNTTYYWRARAAASGAIGATSATAMFRVGPATVSGPYQFTIALGTLCPDPYVNVLLFHGELTVANAMWQFRASDDPGPPIPLPLGPDLLQLILNPSRTIVSGSMQGKNKWVDNAPYYLYFGSSDFSPPPTVPVSGSVSSDGVIAGTFSSRIDLLHRSYSIRNSCTGTFHWILAPR